MWYDSKSLSCSEPRSTAKDLRNSATVDLMMMYIIHYNLINLMEVSATRGYFLKKNNRF